MEAIPRLFLCPLVPSKQCPWALHKVRREGGRHLAKYNGETLLGPPRIESPNELLSVSAGLTCCGTRSWAAHLYTGALRADQTSREVAIADLRHGAAWQRGVDIAPEVFWQNTTIQDSVATAEEHSSLGESPIRDRKSKASLLKSPQSAGPS
ncbi:hypothetical protein NDU88_004396 [Pleurodeles waltl]|uniref:Uncharacterized protein n=1 Tax=Pleurodeles waltl TaxID=8319 RepID=A0AAV7VJU9_PLEWA|nr:hypothetical protein NDU88_004396 [Pleurodeles waltl]